MASSSSTEDMKRIELYKYTHVFRSLSYIKKNKKENKNNKKKNKKTIDRDLC